MHGFKDSTYVDCEDDGPPVNFPERCWENILERLLDGERTRYHKMTASLTVPICVDANSSLFHSLEERVCMSVCFQYGISKTA